MPRFPSEEWFAAVAEIFNGDERYQGAGGGQCSCRAGLVVSAPDDTPKDVFVLTFEGKECLGGERAAAEALADVDFYMHMPLKDWQAMLGDIQAHGHATADHTLNSLDLNRKDGLSTSVHGDQYREDLFFRYNQTLQFFFDASARIKTAA